MSFFIVSHLQKKKQHSISCFCFGFIASTFVIGTSYISRCCRLVHIDVTCRVLTQFVTPNYCVVLHRICVHCTHFFCTRFFLYIFFLDSKAVFFSMCIRMNRMKCIVLKIMFVSIH